MLTLKSLHIEDLLYFLDRKTIPLHHTDLEVESQNENILLCYYNWCLLKAHFRANVIGYLLTLARKWTFDEHQL